jgi:hypothetical protein
MSSMRTAWVTVVTGPGQYSLDAQAALTDLARYFPLSVRMVAADSLAGEAVTRRHRPDSLPIVLLDGGFFSAGRLPRRKLARQLAARTCAPASGPGMNGPGTHRARMRSGPARRPGGTLSGLPVMR